MNKPIKFNVKQLVFTRLVMLLVIALLLASSLSFAPADAVLLDGATRVDAPLVTPVPIEPLAPDT